MTQKDTARTQNLGFMESRLVFEQYLLHWKTNVHMKFSCWASHLHM